jgi:hypothetical protein
MCQEIHWWKELHHLPVICLIKNSIFMCFVRFWEWNVISSLNSINRLEFVREIQCVVCEVFRWTYKFRDVNWTFLNLLLQSEAFSGPTAFSRVLEEEAKILCSCVFWCLSFSTFPIFYFDHICSASTFIFSVGKDTLNVAWQTWRPCLYLLLLCQPRPIFHSTPNRSCSVCTRVSNPRPLAACGSHFYFPRPKKSRHQLRNSDSWIARCKR